MPVPRLLLIFSPLTVRWPCTYTALGALRPLKCSIAGQNSVWKVMMSLPMKCTCSSSGSAMYSVYEMPSPPSSMQRLSSRFFSEVK
ncbi:hypothetical protein D3C72_1708800 [compost metagenome]